MYRYSVDKAITYTAQDILLFRESPFASWMERLTLERPDHGIPADPHAEPSTGSAKRQDELAATLRDEGKRVALIDWDAVEPVRRATTLDAMRSGVDYIVDGQLALGALSCSSNLLMRTSGYSQLGSYLYIPCDTQANTTSDAAFRLSFVAELLHSLQGQLPPQMLVIRGDADLLPLLTEEHIHLFRAVKQRFMAAMEDFHQDKIPDPALSAHFGRWSDFAHDLLRQRALVEDSEPELTERVEPEQQDEPVIDLVAIAAAEPSATESVVPQPRIAARGIPVGDTLAAQARKVPPIVSPQIDGAEEAAGEAASKSLDPALDNLEFIGSERRLPRAVVSPGGRRKIMGKPSTAGGNKPAPSHGLAPAAASERIPAPRLITHSREFDVDCIDDSDYQLPVATAANGAAPSVSSVGNSLDGPVTTTRPFSSSLNTANFPEEID